MEKSLKNQKIPQTDSIEELARFWDTHDLNDVEDELEEVTEPIFERKGEVVMKVRMRPKKIEAVKRIADSKGVKYEELVRQWVREKLQFS